MSVVRLCSLSPSQADSTPGDVVSDASDAADSGSKRDHISEFRCALVPGVGVCVKPERLTWLVHILSETVFGPLESGERKGIDLARKRYVRLLLDG